MVGFSSEFGKPGPDTFFPREAGHAVKRHESGFSLLELLIVIAIAMVMMGIAIPTTLNAVRSYRQTAAVSAATGAIQAARYNAVMHGYSYQVTFTPSTNSYQVYNLPSGSTYVAVGNAIPIARPGDVTMTAAATFTFYAGGTVTPGTLQIKNNFGSSNTLTVSGVGNVTVSSP